MYFFLVQTDQGDIFKVTLESEHDIVSFFLFLLNCWLIIIFNVEEQMSLIDCIFFRWKRVHSFLLSFEGTDHNSLLVAVTRWLGFR